MTKNENHDTLILEAYLVHYMALGVETVIYFDQNKGSGLFFLIFYILETFYKNGNFEIEFSVGLCL